MKLSVKIDGRIGAEIFPGFPTSRRHSGDSHAIIPLGSASTVPCGEPIRHRFLRCIKTSGQKCGADSLLSMQSFSRG